MSTAPDVLEGAAAAVLIPSAGSVRDDESEDSSSVGKVVILDDDDDESSEWRARQTARRLEFERVRRERNAAPLAVDETFLEQVRVNIASEPDTVGGRETLWTCLDRIYAGVLLGGAVYENDEEVVRFRLAKYVYNGLGDFVELWRSGCGWSESEVRGFLMRQLQAALNEQDAEIVNAHSGHKQLHVHGMFPSRPIASLSAV